MQMRWWNVVAAGVVVVHVVEAARVLMLAPIGSSSHKIFFMGIAEALAARNHTVTYLTGNEVSKPRTNIHEVFVPDVNILKNFSNRNLFEINIIQTSMHHLQQLPKCCADALASKEMKKIQEEKFDLVLLSIVGVECFYPYIHSLQVPYIHMTPNIMVGSYSDQAGNPHFPSLMPSLMLDLEYPLTFYGRMVTTLTDIMAKASSFYLLYPRMEEECRKRQLWPDDAPSLPEMRLNGSLFIVNSVQTLENPIIPYVPTVLHAGGIHCRPSQPLPQELEEWVAGAGDAGYIFFSLGSIVKPSFMPEKHKTILLKVFASLEQRVLWKWDQDTMGDLPPNVRLSKWLPQQDILDPRLRLFITHGGLLSTTEATYHSVPILGLPVFLDQHTNMRQVQREGWGRSLLWEDLNFDTLRQTILDLIHDTGVREAVSWRSEVMRDKPLSTERWLTYWVEYILKHRGAHHLRCPVNNLSWYQLYNVDVWLTVVVVMVVVAALAAFLTFKLLFFVWSFLFSVRKPKQD